jgi:hypothetical protein
MTSAAPPPSLQRTTSTGCLNVHLVIEKKINEELIVLSREDLPPVLRTGKLNLNQNIIFRHEGRNSIEGKIIYMRTYTILFSISLL